MRPTSASTMSSTRLSSNSRRVLRNPVENTNQLGRSVSTAIFPVYSSYDRCQIVKGDVGLQANVEQLIHRQLAAGVRQAHDDPVRAECSGSSPERLRQRPRRGRGRCARSARHSNRRTRRFRRRARCRRSFSSRASSTPPGWSRRSAAARAARPRAVSQANIKRHDGTSEHHQRDGDQKHARPDHPPREARIREAENHRCCARPPARA